MPKELFHTITEEKRNRIINAGLEEFSSHLFYDASINRIVKNADISRGSFYQYFEDKEDLIFYLVEEYLKKRINEMFVGTDIGNMNIYEIHRMIFETSLANENKYNVFLKMLYISMDQKLRDRFEKLRNEMIQDVVKTEFSIYLEKYKDRLEEFKILNNMLGSISMGLKAMMMAQNISKKEIMRIYDIEIQILRGEIRFD